MNLLGIKCITILSNSMNHASPNDNQYIDKETIKIADKIQVRSIQIEADQRWK